MVSRDEALRLTGLPDDAARPDAAGRADAARLRALVDGLALQPAEGEHLGDNGASPSKL